MKRIFSCGVVFAGISFLILCGYALFSAEHCSKVLADTSVNNQNDDDVEVVVFLKDLSHESVMETFSERYPEEYELYVYVKESEDPLTSEDIDSDVLDAAISHKRQVYREAYSEWNQQFIAKYADNIEIVFSSVYSPMLLVQIPYQVVDVLEKDDMVEDVSICPSTVYSNDSLAIANTMTRADYVRDTCGNRGSNVKIGLVEYWGKPDVTDSYLSNATITICPTIAYGTMTSLHSTRIARILVGTSANTADDGFAPDAQLYCSSFNGNINSNDVTPYEAIECLISYDVCIINASIDLGEEGIYGPVCKWIDHLAINHDVHFVTTSGNKGNNETFMITAPGLAYNAITVGGYDPGNETQWNYTTQPNIWAYSRYLETGTEYPEKPNLVADCMYFWSTQPDGIGTSFAAPQVAGVIAQLCSYNSTLKVKQTAMGAILMAAAARKVEANNNGKVGSTFNSSVQVYGSSQISDKAGAGVLDARWARDIVAGGKYWTPTVYDSGFPYLKTVSLSADANKTVRVCIFWLRQNSISGQASQHPGSTPSVGSVSDLDLQVIAPNNTTIATSTTLRGNFEIVQFTPMTSGTYTIKIIDNGGHPGKDYIGIALWQGTTGQ